jgi:hypothetical protein
MKNMTRILKQVKTKVKGIINQILHSVCYFRLLVNNIFGKFIIKQQAKQWLNQQATKMYVPPQFMHGLWFKHRDGNAVGLP